jgi:quinol monooxygenase YgiN
MIKVILERHCHPDKAAELENLLVDLRTKAVQQRGYVSGETLRSVDDPSYWLVISTWLDIDLWKAWETSAERREIASRLEPLLTAREKVSIFSFVWEACWWPPDLQRFDRVAKPQAKLRAP